MLLFEVRAVLYLRTSSCVSFLSLVFVSEEVSFNVLFAIVLLRSLSRSLPHWGGNPSLLPGYRWTKPFVLMVTLMTTLPSLPWWS